jgi:hypothetical protein
MRSKATRMALSKPSAMHTPIPAPESAGFTTTMLSSCMPDDSTNSFRRLRATSCTRRTAGTGSQGLVSLVFVIHTDNSRIYDSLIPKNTELTLASHIAYITPGQTRGHSKAAVANYGEDTSGSTRIQQLLDKYVSFLLSGDTVQQYYYALIQLHYESILLLKLPRQSRVYRHHRLHSHDLVTQSPLSPLRISQYAVSSYMERWITVS